MINAKKKITLTAYFLYFKNRSLFAIMSPINKSINFNTIFFNLFRFWKTPRARMTGLIFSLDSFIFSSWLAHIPAVKSNLALSDGELGLSLFGLPLGLLIMNPLTGRIVNHFGAAKSCWVSALLFPTAILFPVHAPNAILLFASLFMAGLATALINVSMNTCVVYVEKQEDMKIMSTCHGMWSLGGVLGASIASVMIFAGFSASFHVFSMYVLMIVLVFIAKPVLETIKEEEKDGEQVNFARPNLALILMILVGFAVSMGEGLAFDWAGVYLHDCLGATHATAALGFAFFSAAMMLLRFSGDVMIARFGDRRLLIWGTLTSVLGIGICILTGTPIVGLLGFFILGLGVALGAPILYAASMRIPDIPPAAGLATFATLSMAGFMAGPPLIGLIGDHWGLDFGLGFVGSLSLVAAGIVLVGKKYF